MPSKNPKQRLEDIIENIEIVRSFIADMDEEEFRADRKTSYAVSRGEPTYGQPRRPSNRVIGG
jgi:uncharacterized protein with HEPN domain